MRALLLAALLACGGCGAKVYPGVGQLIYVTLDPVFSDLYVTEADHTLVNQALAIGDGIRYWDVMGTRFRTRWQLTPDDSLEGAPSIHIAQGPENPNDVGTYWPDGSITLRPFAQDVLADELRDVAAHECGHAIGMEHIPRDKSAVMYFRDEPNKGLDDNDKIQFNNVWGTSK